MPHTTAPLVPATSDDHPFPADSPGDGIVELGEGTGGVFSSLLELYDRRGFDRGYQRAVHDVLGSLVWAAEAFLREHGSPADLRKTVYGFEEHLERHLHSLSPDGGYVSDGLGI